MFEGLYLKKNLVEYQNKHLKERVRELNEDQRRQYFNLLEPVLKDHDTYAVLNYLLLPGLHHFYLGKFFRGSLNLIILIAGASLIFFTKYVFVGTLIIFFILIVELLALFRSQVIVMNHNNLLSEGILESISKI
tara:strand:- start:3938 stop:4339 length:402 start_codon:yes stop_codon:yes gene_type:complete